MYSSNPMISSSHGAFPLRYLIKRNM